MKDEFQNGREILEKAFEEYDRIYCESFSACETEVQTDEALEKQLKKLKMLKKGEGQKFFERIPKRVIGVAAAVLILLSTMTVFVKGDQLLTFVSNTFGTFIEIFFEEEDVQNAPAVIETVYAPTYIPEGYEFDYYEMNINGKISEFQWLGPEGYKICFTQYTFSGKHLIDIEDTAYVEFYHNDTRFLYWTKYGMVEYLWHTDEYLFTLIIQQHFSDEEHWKIINSIEEYKN